MLYSYAGDQPNAEEIRKGRQLFSLASWYSRTAPVGYGRQGTYRSVWQVDVQLQDGPGQS